VGSRHADVPQAVYTSGMLLQASGWLLVVTSMVSLRPSVGFLSSLIVPARQVALPSRCSVRGPCHKTLVMQQTSSVTRQECLQGFSHKFSIYIEDTDCYGVVYNCNYLKFFDRARQTALGLLPLKNLRRKDVELLTTYVDELRLPGAAVLGQELRIESKVVASKGRGGIQWEQSLICEDTDAVLAKMEATTKFVHASSTGIGDVLEAFRGNSSVRSWLEEGEEEEEAAGETRTFVMEGRVHEEEVIVFADDFDGRGRISDLSIAKMFERNRNIALGGPAGLNRLKEEGFLVVVTHFNDFSIHDEIPCEVGDTVRVRSTCQLRKSKFSFFQEVVAASGETKAKARITCLCIDAESKKLRAPPEWVTSQL